MAGIDKMTLRLIPVFLVWAGLLYWTISLFRFLDPHPKPTLLRAALLILLVIFAMQSNLILWAGSLSQQSYMTAGFFWAAAICFRRLPHPVEWWICGTFLGWMGMTFYRLF